MKKITKRYVLCNIHETFINKDSIKEVSESIDLNLISETIRKARLSQKHINFYESVLEGSDTEIISIFNVDCSDEFKSELIKYLANNYNEVPFRYYLFNDKLKPFNKMAEEFIEQMNIDVKSVYYVTDDLTLKQWGTSNK